MDYIREELLRQQALLVILLTGRRPEPAEERETRSDAGEELLPEIAPARRLRQGQTSGAGGEQFWESSLPEAAALWTVLADPSAGGRAGEMTEKNTAGGRGGKAAEKDAAGGGAGEAAERDTAAVRRRSAAAWEAPARTAGEIPPEAGEIRLVTEVRRPESGRSADPAALSLAFQRDARRYDGGFRLY